MARVAVRNLRTRLVVEDAFARQPEIAAVEIPPIVRIMGFPRSGTTLLHNLMALGHNRRALRRWELLDPVPPLDAETRAPDPRIARAQREVEALRGSEIERMHWVEATDPEECTWGFTDLSGLLGRGIMVLMPEWSAELYEPGRTQRRTYQEYRRLIQLLLFRNRLPADGVLVLKSPADTPAAQDFLEVFPEAQVVLTHRDPYRVATSARRIQQVVSAQFLEPGSELTAGDLQCLFRNHPLAADAMVSIAKTSSSRVHHLLYADLMADPVAAVLRTWEKAGLPVDVDLTTMAVRRYLADQRQGGRAAPPDRYTYDDLDPAEVRREASLMRYQTVFRVPVEDQRLTQTN